jgi:hypothetical protein
MYTLRLWTGSILFAIGISFWVWFFRNLFRDRLNRAKLFVETNSLIIISWNLVWVIVGLWIYPIPKTIPLLGLIAGLMLGRSISRPSPHRYDAFEECLQEPEIYYESTEEQDEK